GATLPASIRDVRDQQTLLGALAAHGFGAELIEKIAHRNWLALLGRVWR
ncbi:MAG: membrane dipeptidase, partial [Rhizobium sp.]|nr:membrane dipeptidase [Rhizobium sp.]